LDHSAATRAAEGADAAMRNICKHKEFDMLMGPIMRDCDWDYFIQSGIVRKMRPATDAVVERYKEKARSLGKVSPEAMQWAAEEIAKLEDQKPVGGKNYRDFRSRK